MRWPKYGVVSKTDTANINLHVNPRVARAKGLYDLVARDEVWEQE